MVFESKTQSYRSSMLEMRELLTRQKRLGDQFKKCYPCPLFRFYPSFIQIISRFYPNFIKKIGWNQDKLGIWYFVTKIVLTYYEKKNCSSDWEKVLKFVTEGQEFAKFWRSLEQFVRTMKGKNNFLVTECFFNLFQKYNKEQL